MQFEGSKYEEFPEAAAFFESSLETLASMSEDGMELLTYDEEGELSYRQDKLVDLLFSDFFSFLEDPQSLQRVEKFIALALTGHDTLHLFFEPRVTSLLMYRLSWEPYFIFMKDSLPQEIEEVLDSVGL